MTEFRTKIRNFFIPPRNSSRWMLILPYTDLVAQNHPIRRLVGHTHGITLTPQHFVGRHVILCRPRMQPSQPRYMPMYTARSATLALCLCWATTGL